ncbi:MAG: hypothetical protein ACK4NF_04210 [Planctomycetota bacterium]
MGRNKKVFLITVIYISLLFADGNLNKQDTPNSSTNTQICRDKKCETSDKKHIRKKVLEKLVEPFQPPTPEPIFRSLEDVEKFQHEQEFQIDIKKIKSQYSAVQKVMEGFDISNLISLPHLPNTKFLQNGPINDDIVTTIKFQRMKYEVIQYLMQSKAILDIFWSIVRNAIFNDERVLTTMKHLKGEFCFLENNFYDKNIVSMTEKINFSPIRIHRKHLEKETIRGNKDYFENLLSCHQGSRLKIKESNDICANLLILNNRGRCLLKKISKKLFKCVSSSSQLKSNCHDFRGLLNSYDKQLTYYLQSARTILQKQLLPLYFAIKLSTKLSRQVLKTDAYLHIIYKNVISEWLHALFNLENGIPFIKKKIGSLKNVNKCNSFVKNASTYLDRISADIRNFRRTFSELEKLKRTNETQYRKYLRDSFPRFLEILTKKIEWTEDLGAIVKKNITKRNSLCVFMVARSMISEINNHSKLMFQMSLNDLIFYLPGPYKIYAYLTNLEQDDFSLKDFLGKEISSKKLRDFALFDYKLALLHLYYNVKKCEESVNGFDEFLRGLGYIEKHIKVIMCLLNKKGDIGHCDEEEELKWTQYIVGKIEPRAYRIENHNSIVKNISGQLASKKIAEIFEEYKVCCEKKCEIPDYCEHSDIINFCKSCNNPADKASCLDENIQKEIKECCFRGIIQNIDASTSVYDPCKFGYKVVNNVFQWEYPELRCSIGTKEQQKCYNLLLNYTGKLGSVLKYLLEDYEGNFDNGKTFCSDAKGKLDRLCCNKINICSLCENIDKYELCVKDIPDIFNLRLLYEKSLRELTSDNFVNFLKRKIKTYGKKGFYFQEDCDIIR